MIKWGCLRVSPFFLYRIERSLKTSKFGKIFIKCMLMDEPVVLISSNNDNCSIHSKQKSYYLCHVKSEDEISDVDLHDLCLLN